MGSDSDMVGVTENFAKDLEGVVNADADPPPEHLVILVNGIVGSPADWEFAAQRLKLRLGRHVAIHCSQASSKQKTFHGVDVMGKRLADEVQDIIKKTPGVTKISFLAHSLGGLVSRYAISQLYHPPKDMQNGEHIANITGTNKDTVRIAQSESTIGGLRAENFITLATPHLSCRGSSQLPFLFGFRALEKIASLFAHWFIGRTGKHLFLADGSATELPLLRKMATDCKEGQFISSLGAFRKRTVYANVANDMLVGWRTSSIRKKSELPKIDHTKGPLDPKYPHIFREEDPPPPRAEDLARIDQNLPNRSIDALEDDMVAGLTRLSWHRVDVSFRGSYQGHNLIQVNDPISHMAGEDVMAQVIDKQFGKSEGSSDDD